MIVSDYRNDLVTMLMAVANVTPRLTSGDIFRTAGEAFMIVLTIGPAEG
jgi:hypothetical protein